MADKCPEHQEHDKRTRALEQATGLTSQSVVLLTETVTAFVSEVRTHMTDARDRVVRLELRDEQRHEQVDILFSKVREVEVDFIPRVENKINQYSAAMEVKIESLSIDQHDSYQTMAARIQPIENQHLMEKGGWKVLKDIRVLIPVLFSIVLGLLQLWQWTVPHLKHLHKVTP